LTSAEKDAFSKKIETEFKVIINIVDEGQVSKINYNGPKVKQVTKWLEDNLLPYLKFELPDCWQDTVNQFLARKNCVLKSLLKKSQEWKIIEAKFKGTVLNGQISSIKRI
jgi:hypothetical protein